MFCFPSCSWLDEEQQTPLCLFWTEPGGSVINTLSRGGDPENFLSSSQKRDLNLTLLFQISERTESLNRSLKKR